MKTSLSPRLSAIVNALPLFDGIRVLEIGCGPGAAAREIAHRIGNGHILAIDRSLKAIQQAIKGSQNEINMGRLSFRHVTIENFELLPDDLPFDLVLAVRVGSLDGRHPKQEKIALSKIAKILTKDGAFYIDGGNPLKKVDLDKL